MVSRIAVWSLLLVTCTGCSVASLAGGDIPCANNDACPPERATCLEGRCVDAPDDDRPSGEGEGEGEIGEGEGEGEGEIGEGEGEGEGEGGPRCGDGRLDGPAEQCDDGNGVNGDFCTNACTTATCGDEVLHEGVEDCDDGVGGSSTCTADCRAIVCGDGRAEGNEECDDGNTSGLDTCTPDCRVDRCGNGQIDAGEACDDGNRQSLDGCSARCDRIAWRVTAGTAIGPGAGPLLLLAGGLAFVVVGTGDGEVVGVAVNTGQPFRVPVGEAVVSVVVTDSQVVAATSSGDVVGIGIETGGPEVVWRRDDVAVAGGRARLASVDDRVFVVMPTGGVRALDGAGQNAIVTADNGNPYTLLGTAPAPLTSAVCDPCLPVLVSSASDESPPGAVFVPMGNTIALWNVENACLPTRVAFGTDTTETARTRAVAASGETVVVTSRGALVRLDATGTCNQPVDSTRRIEGSFTAEPISVAVDNAVAWVVPDATRLRAMVVAGSGAVVELSGYPAALPPGRTVRVPAARDATGAFVVVDDTGELHVYGPGGARRSLGSVGATPAAGPLLIGTGQSRPALAVVATADGQVVAVENAPGPASSGWHRDGGDQRGTAHAACTQGGVTPLLPLLPVVLGWRRRRPAQVGG